MAVTTILLCASAAHSQTYTITEIGTLGGPLGRPIALNNAGVVVGTSSTAEAPNVARAFRWENGSIIDLGTFGGPSAEAFGISETGQITGYAETADSIPFNETYHAFRWTNGSMVDLGTTGGQSSRGYAINDAGSVVGISQVCFVDPKNPGGPCFPVGNEYATLWEARDGDDLGGLFGSSDSSAFAINSAGQIVGQSIAVSGFSQPRHAALWTNGGVTDLGTLGGFNSWAFDINDNGQITGLSDTPGNTAHHPFIFALPGGPMIDIGVPEGTSSGEAVAINAFGDVVGQAFHCCGSIAFLYHDGSMIDLNQTISAESGWDLQAANDINDAGWIIGVGTHNGATRGFLLKPAGGCGRDVNCSGAVDVDDLLAVITSWGACPSLCLPDVAPAGGNGVVNVDDLLAVITNWG